MLLHEFYWNPNNCSYMLKSLKLEQVFSLGYPNISKVCSSVFLASFILMLFSVTSRCCKTALEILMKFPLFSLTPTQKSRSKPTRLSDTHYFFSIRYLVFLFQGAFSWLHIISIIQTKCSREGYGSFQWFLQEDNWKCKQGWSLCLY